MIRKRGCRLAALGIVNALGVGVEAIGPRLFSGDASRLVWRDDLFLDRPLLVGAVHEGLPDIPDSFARFRCRTNALALAALEQIAEPVRVAMDLWGAGRVGVVIGSTTAGVAEAGEAVAQLRVTGRLTVGFDYAQLEHGGIATMLSRMIGARGPSYTVSMACSSAAQALASASRLLRSGLCDAVVAGGSDALCPMTASGFCTLEAVSKKSSQPFSAARDGLILGEGAALFLVTREEGGIRLLGTGNASDAHHMSAPHPDGHGAERAWRAALDDAGIAPEDLDYVNLHGTGTALNDAMEARVVHRVLGGDVPCSSTKPLVGHTLGAAGAMEAAFLWMSLSEASGGCLPLPPHVWDGVADPSLPTLNFVKPPTNGRQDLVGSSEWTVMGSSSFAFGGNNSVLIIGARN